MWNCRVCNVEFVLESVEEHLYRNHMRPVVGELMKVYNCGDCLFDAEGFQHFAIHCIRNRHKPTQVNKGLQYDDYVSQLFVALEEAMDLSEVASETSSNQDFSVSTSPLEPTHVSYECKDISWVSSSSSSSESGGHTDGKSIPSYTTADQGPSISVNPPNSLLSQNGQKAGGSQPLSAGDGALTEEEELEAFINGEDMPTLSPASNLKLYACPYCPKQFSRSTTLRYHVASHTKEKVFECKTCGKTFSYRQVLANHERTHSGEKPFKCAVQTCNKTFANAGSVRYHLRKGHNRVEPPKKHPIIIVPSSPGNINASNTFSPSQDHQKQPVIIGSNPHNNNQNFSNNMTPVLPQKVEKTEVSGDIGKKKDEKTIRSPESFKAETTKEEDCS